MPPCSLKKRITILVEGRIIRQLYRLRENGKVDDRHTISSCETMGKEIADHVYAYYYRFFLSLANQRHNSS